MTWIGSIFRYLHIYVNNSQTVLLFWTQSGYSLKAAPLLSPEQTHDQNLDALKRHFKRTVPHAGDHNRHLQGLGRLLKNG